MADRQSIPDLAAELVMKMAEARSKVDELAQLRDETQPFLKLAIEAAACSASDAIRNAWNVIDRIDSVVRAEIATEKGAAS